MTNPHEDAQEGPDYFDPEDHDSSCRCEFCRLSESEL